MVQDTLFPHHVAVWHPLQLRHLYCKEFNKKKKSKDVIIHGLSYQEELIAVDSVFVCSI